MLRIKVDALSMISGKYFHKDTLFSGITYLSENMAWFKAISIVNGVVVDSQVSPISRTCVSLLGLDISGFTENDMDGYEPEEMRNDAGLTYQETETGLQLLFNGEPYTGIAYEFKREFCIREECFNNGFSIAQALWDKAGTLLELAIEDELEQQYAWRENGVAKSAQIIKSTQENEHSVSKRLTVHLVFSNDGQPSSLQLEGDLTTLEKAIHSAERFPIRSLYDWKNCVAATEFGFYGNSDTYEIFELMVKQGFFNETKEMIFPSTLLTNSGCVDLFVGMKNLSRIDFLFMHADEIEIARKIKSQRPDLEIKAECIIPNKPGTRDYCTISAN